MYLLDFHRFLADFHRYGFSRILLFCFFAFLFFLILTKLEVRVAFARRRATNGLGIGGGESKPALTYPCARTYLPMLNNETSFPLHFGGNQGV